MRGRNSNALPRHEFGEDRRARTSLTEPIIERDLAIIEHDVAERGGSQTHLCMSRTASDAARRRFDDKTTDTAKASLFFIRHGTNDEKVGHRTVGDENSAPGN